MFCNKQYTGKSETAFNLSLNNHRKDVNKQKLLQADQNFWLSGHNFNKHSKFTLIEQLNDNDKQGTIKTSAKKKLEDFWIIKLYNHMDSMLKWISQIPNISVFLVHLFLWNSYTEGTSKVQRQNV